MKENLISIKTKLTILIILLTFSLTACTPHPSTLELASNQSLTFWFRSDLQYQLYSPMIDSFSSKYASTNITIKKFDDLSQEEYYTKLKAEIMSGNGPDIIFYNTQIDNIYKMMLSGAFFDLNLFLDKDPDYIAGNYYQDVINGGQLDNKQLIMPLSFNLNFMVSTQSQIKATGFSTKNCNTFLGFVNELAQLIPLSDKQKILGGQDELVSFSSYISNSALDYQKRSVVIDTPEIRNTLEVYKKIYSITKGNRDSYFEPDIANKLHEKKSIFEIFYGNPMSVGAAINYYEAPVIIPRYTFDGKLKAFISEGLAINNTSSNKELAYLYIKHSIELEQQDRANQFSFGAFPVLKEALSLALDNQENLINEKTFYDVKPLPESYRKDVELLFEHPMDATMDTYANVIMRRAFIEYFEDKISLNECLKELQIKLEIYISE